MSKKLKTWAAYLVPVLLMVAVALFFLRMQAHRTENDSKTARDKGAPIPVNVFRAEPGDIDLNIPTECVAQANPAVQVSTPVSHRPVGQTHVRIGQYIRRGTPLLVLDDRQESIALKNAEAQLPELEAYVTAQQERADFFQQMRSRGMGLERDFKQALSDLAKARVDLGTARAALGTARVELARTRIASPVDGVVMSVAQPGEVELSTTTGSTANGSGTLASVGVINPIMVECPLPEEKLLFLRPGQEVSATFPSLPGKRFEGTLTRINPGAKPEERTVAIAVELANPDRLLLPGVHGLIEVRERWSGLRIPSVALLNPRVDVAQVFVIDAEGRAKLRRIGVGAAAGGYVQVREGLADGEQVVVIGQVGLRDGDAVRINEEVAADGEKP